MATSECGLAEEYIVRVCSAARAKRTCDEAWVVIAGINSTCTFREECMRCVPSADALGKASCVLDSVTFLGDGSCPELVDTSICDGCASIIMQEVCIGLCSFNCKWTNVSWMRGDYCSIREPPPEEEDNTLMMVVMIAAAAVGGIVVCIVLRLLCKMRQRALEASRQEANREARKGRGSQASQDPRAGRGSQASQVSKARQSVEERNRLSKASEGPASSDLGERVSSITQSTESEEMDKPEERGLFRPQMLRKKYGHGSSGKDQDDTAGDTKTSQEDEAADNEDGDEEGSGEAEEEDEEEDDGENEEK